MDELTKRIQELMEARELSRQQFAAQTHISLSTLSNIFNGRSHPTLKQVQAIITAFPTISQQWLITGRGDMFLRDNEMVGMGNGDMDAAMEPSLFDLPKDSPTPSPATSHRETAVMVQENTPSPVVKEVKIVETKVRQISEIRVFYEDNTWETFVLKK